jgi:hypothetical protein
MILKGFKPALEAALNAPTLEISPLESDTGVVGRDGQFIPDDDDISMLEPEFLVVLTDEERDELGV